MASTRSVYCGARIKKTEGQTAAAKTQFGLVGIEETESGRLGWALAVSIREIERQLRERELSQELKSLAGDETLARGKKAEDGRRRPDEGRIPRERKGAHQRRRGVASTDEAECHRMHARVSTRPVPAETRPTS
eukprot:2059637-Pleurochrysis_carterae.AAC.1